MKRIIGICMTLTMLLMCFPAHALATENEGPVSVLLIEGINALENPTGDGWSFDASTGVLTLTNCNLTRDHTYAGEYDAVNSIIYADGDLIIELVGTNHIERVLENVPSVDIVSAITVYSNEQPLKIRGSGTLTAGVSASSDMFDALSSTWMYGVSTNMSADLTGLFDGGCVDVYGGLQDAAPRTDCGRAWNNYITYNDSAKVLSYNDIDCAYQQSWYNWNENNVWRLIVSEGETTTPVATELEWVPEFPETSEFSVETLQELHTAMLECLEEQLDEVDYAWAGSRLFDITATVWNPNSGSWEEPNFETVGSILISIPLSAFEGATADDEFFVLHVFEYGDECGTFETPSASVSNRSVTFSLAGFSPVLITWRSRAATYTVTFAAGEGSGEMAPADGVSGEYVLPACTFTAPSGKQFKAWSIGGVEKAAGATVEITADTTVTAVWEAIPVTYYAVTFDPDGGSAVAAQSIEAGHKATAPVAPTKEGFDFKGWTLDGSAYDFDSVVNANITLVASWEAQQATPVEYIVTYIVDGATYKTETYPSGASITMPSVPSKAGYTGAWDAKVTVVTENVTVTAVYTAIPDSPQTGDDGALFLWVVLLGVSSVALVSIVVCKRRMLV